MKDELLTIKEASAFFGVSTRTLLRWEEKGLLTSMRTVGNQRRYSKQHIANLFKAPARPTPAPPIPEENTPSPVPQFQQEKKPSMHAALTGGVAVGGAVMALLVLMIISFPQIGSVLASATDWLRSPETTGEIVASQKGTAVLGETNRRPEYELRVNVPSIFKNSATFLDSATIKKQLSVSGVAQLNGGVTTNNKDIDAGTGKLTASNVVYSLLAGTNVTLSGDPQNPTISATGGVTSIQGQTGAIALSGGTGITVAGTTISNTDPGSGQNIFKTITAGGTTIIAGNNNDQLTFAAGSGITLAGDANSKTVTITSNAAGVLSGLTVNGVLYATSATTATSTNAGTNGYILKSNGSGLAPTWEAPGTVLGFLPFDFISSGTNTSAAMVVGSGASLGFTGTGTINASSLLGSTWAAPGSIGSTTPNTGAFTTLTANTLNGLIITNTGSNTLTIASGKTFTVNNSLTLAGTDATTFTFPSSSGTVVTTDAAQTLTNKTIAAGSNTITGLTNANLSGSAGITNANLANSSITVTAGSGLSGGGAVSLGGTVSLANAGVKSATAGTGITIDQATGDITITNNGVTSAVAGSGISVSGGTGAVTFTNTGVTSLTGTANQISVSGATGAVTLSLPQNIHSGATPTFAGLTLSTLTTNGGVLYTNGTGTFAQTSAGSSGQCLQSSGGGAPTWGACAAANYFQRSGTTLSPATTGDSLLLADSGTTSNYRLEVNGKQTGKALVVFNETGNQAIFTASASGATKFTIANNGDVTIAGNVSAANFSGSSTGTNTGDVSLAGQNYLSLSGQTITANAINLSGSHVTSTLGIGNGGTGVASTPSNGQILIGNGSGYTLATITQGTGIGISNGSGTITITNSGVTSLTGTASQISVSGATGAVTLSLPQNIDTSSSPTFNGLTLGGLTNNGGILYTNPSGVLNQTSVGSLGQCLTSSGGGAPTWSTCAAGQNLWQSNNGTLSPFSSTLDLLIGGTATNSAKVGFLNVNSGTPTASISGVSNNAVSLAATGILGTTNAQTLQLGSSSTGNVSLNPGGSAALTASTNGNVGIGAAPAANNRLYVNGSTSTPLALDTSNAQTFIQFLNSSVTKGYIGYSANGASGLGFLDATGNIVNMLVTNNGSVGIGSTSPLSTLDVRGNSGTTPIASFSGSTSRAGLIVDNSGVGDLFTASSSGLNRFVIKQNGNIGIGTSTPSEKLSVVGNFDVQDTATSPTKAYRFRTSGSALDLDAGGSDLFISAFSDSAFQGTQYSQVRFSSVGFDIMFRRGFFPETTGSFTMGDATHYWGSTYSTNLQLNGSAALDGSTVGIINIAGKVGIGAANPLAQLDIRNSTAHQPTASISGTTSSAGLIVDNNGSGDLFAASKSGASKFTIQNTGNVQINNLASCPSVVTNASGVLSCGSFAATQNYWQLNNGALAPFSNTLDLLVGGTATSSAKFAFYNVNTGTPTASISAQSTNNALSLDANGTIFTTNKQSLTLGNSSTGNIILNGGNVGIGTTAPGYALDIQSGDLNIGGNDLYLNGNQRISDSISGSVTTFRAQGGALSLFDGTNNQSLYVYGINGTTYARTFATNTSAGFTTNATSIPLNLQSNGGSLGVNTFAPLATFDVRGNSGTTPAASISGQTARAALVVDNSGVGDLFTASKSGATKFVITNAGNVGIGTATPGQALDISGNINLSGTVFIGNSVALARSGGNLLINNTGLANAGIIFSTGGPVERARFDGTTGAFGIGTTSPLTTLHVNGANSAGRAAFIVDQTASSSNDIFTASASGVTKFTIANNGVLNASAYTTNGGLLYTNGSGTVAQTSAGSSTQCLLGGTTPTWGSCALGTNYWQLNSGVLSPFSNTADLLVGGTSTASAKFAFINNTGAGTPTASISANSGNIATYLQGDGFVGTTNAQTLTLGTSSTGNVILAPGGVTALTAAGANLTGAGTFTSTGLLTANAGITVTGGTANINATGTGATSIGNGTGTVTLTLGGDTRGDIYYRNASGNLARLGIGASNTFLTGGTDPSWTAGYVNDATNTTLTRSGSGPYTLGLNLGNANTWTATQTYNTGLTIANNSTLTVNTGSNLLLSGLSASSVVYTDGSKQLTTTAPTSGTIGYWTRTGTNLSPATSTDTLSLGTTTPLATFDVRGNSGTTPVASFSGQTSFASMVVDNRGSGDLFTASSSGLNRFVIKNNGNVNIGTTSGPAWAKLYVAGDIGATGNYVLVDNQGFSWGDSTVAVNGNSATDFLSFVTNNINRLYINSAGSIGIGTQSPIATLDVRGNSATTPVASLSGNTNFATMLVDNNGTGDLFTASKSGATKFTILNNGNLQFAGTNTVLSTLASAATTAQTWTLPNATGTLCIQGSTACGFAMGTNYWQSASNGVISPYNDTVDLLIGGTSSSSAKFAFINVNSGTPTASISGNLSLKVPTGANPAATINLLNGGNLGFYTSAGGDSGLSANPALYIRNDGHIGIGTTNANAPLDVNGWANIDYFINPSEYGIQTGGGLRLTQWSTSFPNVYFSAYESGAGFKFSNNANGSLNELMYLSGTGSLGIGNFGSNAPLATLDVRGNSGTTPFASVSGTTAKAAMVIDNSGVGDIFTASKSGAKKFTVLNNGDIQITNLTTAGGVMYTNGSGTVSQTSQGASGQCLQSQGVTGAPTWGSCATGTNLWQQNSGAISPFSNTLDLLVGGTSTASAKFGVLNVNNGTPTASISAGLAGGAYLTATGTLGTTNKQTLTIGGSTTGNINFNNFTNCVLTTDSSGNLTCGGSGGQITVRKSADQTNTTNTLTPNGVDSELTFNVAANETWVFRFVVNETNPDGGNFRYTVVAPSGSTCNLTANGYDGIDSTSAYATELRNASCGSVGTYGGSLTSSHHVIDGSVSVGATGGSVTLQFADEGGTSTTVKAGSTLVATKVGGQGSGSGWADDGSVVRLVDSSDSVGIGTNTPLATLDVQGNSGITPVASIAGATAFASMIVDQSGVGDIFTASRSGSSKFTIKNNGSVLFAGDILSSSSSAKTTNNGSGSVYNALGDSGSLVPNASFEGTSTGATMPDGWVAAATNSATLSIDSTTAGHGTNSIKFSTTATNQSAAFYSPCIPLSGTAGNVDYNLQFQEKAAQAGNTTIRTYIDQYTTKANCQNNTSPTILISSSNPATTSTSWTGEATGTPSFSLDSTTKWGRVHFFMASAQNGANAVTNIDSVRLIEASVGGGLDYAENYPADPNHIPEPGDVISLTSTGSAALVTPTTKYKDTAMIGIVSTKPGQTLDDGTVPSPKVAVALAGRVPTKVSTAKGVIHVGDLLTSSTAPGVAVKATEEGPVIGTAMEDYTDADTTKVGSIVIFVKPSWYRPLTITDTGNISIFDQTTLADTNSLIASQSASFGLRDGTGNTITNTGAFSDVVVGNLRSGSINTQKLILAGKDVTTRLDTLERTASSAAQLTNRVNSLEQNLLSLNDKVASLQAQLDLSLLTSHFSSLNASSAAELGLDKLDVKDATITNNLSVIGKTTLADLGVTGRVTIGLLAVNGLSEGTGQAYASINTSSGPLHLQSDGLNGIDIFNGKVIFDIEGNIKTVGVVEAKTVNTTKLNIIPDTETSQSAVLSSSAGTITIPAGQTNMDVITAALTSKSLIFATPDSPITVGAKAKDDDTFTIKFQSAQKAPVKVNWWIVN